MVVVGGQSHPVVVRYEPNEFVAEVKKLIVAKLKNAFDEFDSVKAGYLTLRTLDGSLIVEDEMPNGKKFLAELVIPQCKSFL